VVFTGLEVDSHDERITRYTSCSVRVVVCRAWVGVGEGLGTLGDGLEVQNRHVVEQVHDIRLHQATLLPVPLGSLENETSNVGSILSVLRDVTHGPGDDEVIEIKSIDGNNVSSERSTGESLQEGGVETVRVHEGRDKVHVG